MKSSFRNWLPFKTWFRTQIPKLKLITRRKRHDGDYTRTKRDEEYKRLKDKLVRGEEEGKILKEKGRGLSQRGQSMEDLSRATQVIIQFYKPPIDDLIKLNNEWGNYDFQAGNILETLGLLDISALNSSGTTVTFTSTIVFNEEDVIRCVPQSHQPIVLEHISRIKQIAERDANKQEVIDLMKTFRLDLEPKGEKTSVELFITAYAAFENPVENNNPISTSLIPMREAIHMIIDHLLNERPKQESAKNWTEKIKSMGTQLKWSIVKEDAIQTWADQWHKYLLPKLSESKWKDMTREEWQDLMTKATLFIKTLLSGLDPSRMKSRIVI